jgi:hypothetical protein
MWCVAQLDEEYIRRMEDVLGVYEKPLSEQEPVVCIDEKPVVARRDGEYERCGTANVFCGVEPKAGRHFPKVTANRSSPEFADYLLEIAEKYPAADTIHLVLDNLSSHTRKAVVERFGEAAGSWLWERFTAHYTPQARELAESGGDRHQRVLAAMPGATPHRRYSTSATRNAGLGSSRESRPGEDRMEIYPTESPPKVRLHFHPVTVLVDQS